MTKLYPYQREDVERMFYEFKGRCILGSEMGLGKTPQSLFFAKNHIRPRPVVVICPAIIKEQWRREAAKHVGIRADVLYGQTPPKRSPIARARIYIINYDILQYWVDWLRKLKPVLVIIDEFHRIRSWEAQCTQAAVELCKGVKHVIPMSGTPIVNDHADLFPVLHILFPKRFKSFINYAFKYCLHPNAPILMADLTEKPISEIKIGDKIIGWTYPDGGNRKLVVSEVLDVIKKQAPLQKVELENGDELICTPDHQWATGFTPNHSTGKEYTIARTGALGGKGRWNASRVMELLSGTKPKFPEDTNYMIGYVHGFFRGDGYCTKQRIERHHPFKKKKVFLKWNYGVGCACKDKPPIKRIHKYLTILGIRHTFKQRRDGLWCIGKMSNKKGYNFILNSIKKKSRSWWAGFLGGIYDAEGSRLSFAQCRTINPETSEMIEKALDKFDIPHVRDKNAIRMNAGKKHSNTGRGLLIDFWNIANPTLRRKLLSCVINTSKISIGNNSRLGPYVSNIIPLKGTHTTYTLTTETGNYIAWGYGSKNCQPKMYRGRWLYKGARNGKRLRRFLVRHCLIRRLKKDVIKDLPPKIVTVVPIRMGSAARKEYNNAERDIVRWLEQHRPGKASRARYNQARAKFNYLKRLAVDLTIKERQEWLANFHEESNSKILVFGWHVEIMKAFHTKFPNSVLIIGETSQKKRDLRVRQFNGDKKTKDLFGNLQAAGAGWNCTSSSNVAFMELGFTPADHNQAIDRCHGIGRGVKGEPVNVYFLVAEDTIEESICSILTKKQGTSDKVIDGKSRRKKSDRNIYDLLERRLMGKRRR